MNIEEVGVTGQAVLDALVAEVDSWPGVVSSDHRFAGIEFKVGRREIGHVHVGEPGRSFADLPFPRAKRNELIAEGRARPHHVLPDSGWLTVPIRTASDVEDVIEIFRENYSRTSAAKKS